MKKNGIICLFCMENYVKFPKNQVKKLRRGVYGYFSNYYLCDCEKSKI